MDPDAKPKTPRVVITASALAGALRTDPREISGDLSPSAPHWPLIPGYRLVRLIGEGGGGRVFEAVREGGSQMPVALKVVRQPLGTSGRGSGMDRVWRELDLLSELRLESVPRVVDWGTVDGRMYIATELVQGEGLQEYCDRSRLTLRGRVEMLVEVCRAVASVHDALVVHRDLKPSNILVDGKGKPVIVDFGVARLATDEPGETVTITGEVVGTTPFIAPEVARSQPGALRSVQADVYGLGATAYVILTGQPPREERTTAFERLKEAADGTTRDPRTLNPALPRSLAAVLRKACERNPARRYRTAEEFGEDLRRWSEGRPVLARRSSWMSFVQWTSRHPILATFAACLALVGSSVASVGVFMKWYLRQPDRIAIYHEGSSADLVSRAGVVLHTWKGESTNSVLIAEKARSGVGSRELAVVALRNASHEKHNEQLAVYELDRTDVPIWSIGGTEHDFVTPDGSHSSGGMRPQCVEVARVFPEVRGDQIIAVFCKAGSCESCIRVYDCGGKVLYEAWHYGEISSARWLPEKGTLLLAGVTNKKEVLEKLHTVVAKGPCVPIVFGVRPGFGAPSQWLNQGDTTSPSLAWYRYLQPLRACAMLHQGRINGAWFSDQAGWSAALHAQRSAEDASSHVQWRVSWTGRVDERLCSSSYEGIAGAVDADKLFWSETFDAIDTDQPEDDRATEQRIP